LGGGKAEFGYQAGAAGDGDAGDAGGGGGEDGDSEGVMGSAAVAVVGGRGGLAVGKGGRHQPVSGKSDHMREVTQACHAAAEPGASADQFDGGIGAQRLLQGGGIGVLEPGDIAGEQFPGVRPAERSCIRSGLMSTLKSSPSTRASLDSVVNDGSCSPASNRAIAG
jgi:hypothetical protein